MASRRNRRGVPLPKRVLLCAASWRRFNADNWLYPAGNLPGFPGVVAAWDSLGLVEVVFNRFVPSGLGSIYRETIGVPSDEELLPVLTEGDRQAARYGIAIQLGVPIAVPPSLRSQWQN